MSLTLWDYETKANLVKAAEAALATAESNLIQARRAKEDAWRTYVAELEARHSQTLPSNEQNGGAK